MLIKDILDLDAAEQPAGALKNVLGDGLLLKRNFVYRNIRLGAKRLGFCFVEAWPEYSMSGLTQLERIITTRKIPLHHNRGTLEEIHRRAAVPMRLSHLPDPLENHHLHEAAHCIAEHIFRDVRPRNVEEKILKSFICESFANSIDAMVGACADDDEQMLFVRLNSYMHETRSALKLRAKLNERIGFNASFLVVLISYLHANFLFERLSLNSARAALKFAAPNRKSSQAEIKHTKRVMDLGLKLSLTFRARTNSFYLNCQGIEGDFTKILDFDFMSMIANTLRWERPIRRLADFAETGK